MDRRHFLRYLCVLATAIIVWFPLFPFFYSLTSDQVPFAERFIARRPRYVYFGDSVLATSTECETDHRSVFEEMPAPFSSETLGFNSQGGYANLWQSTARFIAARNSGSVVAAVVPINMSVFSVWWEQSPQYDNAPGQMFYALASGQFSMSEYWGYLKQVYSPWKQEEFERRAQHAMRLQIVVGARTIGTASEVISRMELPKIPCRADPTRYAIKLGLHYAVNYGQPISANDSNFKNLEEIVRRLRASNIHTLLYITPLDKEDIRRFGGSDVATQLEKNLAVVKRVARENNWELIDLSGALPSANFITRECACEHVDSAGRTLIARNVSVALRRDGL